MPRGQKHDTPETIQAEIEKNEKLKKYYERQVKVIEKGLIPELNRKARTNRLCTRAGMLESFIPHPELLSNDQIMELLKIAFRQKEVQDALQEMVKSVVPEDPQEDP